MGKGNHHHLAGQSCELSQYTCQYRACQVEIHWSHWFLPYSPYFHPYTQLNQNSKLSLMPLHCRSTIDFSAFVWTSSNSPNFSLTSSYVLLFKSCLDHIRNYSFLHDFWLFSFISSTFESFLSIWPSYSKICSSHSGLICIQWRLFEWAGGGLCSLCTEVVSPALTFSAICLYCYLNSMLETHRRYLQNFVAFGSL